MKPHLLYIAFWYPPSRASGVYRALATTRAFVDAGWQVTVLTTTEEFLFDEVGSIDQSLLDLVPAGVEVVRVPFAFGSLSDVDVQSLGRFRANFPTLWRKIHEKAAPLWSITSFLRGEIETAHQITERYTPWIDPAVQAGRRVHSGTRVDYVLATGNPYSSFEAARLLSGLIGVPYSVDYRDPWTIDVFTGRVDNADRATTEAEREIVTAADFCFQVNAAIAEAYGRKFPESANKQVVVLNGYDADSIPPPAVPAEGALRFGILGTLNDNWPIDSIFKAWTDIRSQLPSGSTLVLGGNLGYFQGSRELLEAYLPDESVGFHYVGPVPKAEVAAFYVGTDVVVVPIPGGPMVTSGKIFEAMATGRPLVCVQQRDGGGRSLVEDWPLAFGCDPDPESIAAATLEAARSAQHLDPEVSRAVQIRANDFERTRTIAVMVDSVASRVAATTRT